MQKMEQTRPPNVRQFWLIREDSADMLLRPQSPLQLHPKGRQSNPLAGAPNAALRKRSPTLPRPYSKMGRVNLGRSHSAVQRTRHAKQSGTDSN